MNALSWLWALLRRDAHGLRAWKTCRSLNGPHWYLGCTCPPGPRDWYMPKGQEAFVREFWRVTHLIRGAR